MNRETCFQEAGFRILPKEFRMVPSGPAGCRPNTTPLWTHSSNKNIFFSPFIGHRAGKGQGGWALIPTHLPSIPPSPPHHLPQPLPLFSAPISRHVEKMLSRISHFQRVGVADSGPKIWTITPPDSSRVPPRPGEGSCSTH